MRAKMHLANLTAIFFAQSTIFALPPLAYAESFDTRIENEGAHTITALYVTTTVLHLLVGEDAFGSNMLEHDMAVGDSATLHTTPKNNQCNHDLKVVYADGHTTISREMDLCEARNITLTY